mmetsp:Transcript_48447/g.113381  ORF Transcript_48447/g.113381 Transcript_48447/m.113381 type:complete len:259 (-) Transcript_48447:15-791(-)
MSELTILTISSLFLEERSGCEVLTARLRSSLLLPKSMPSRTSKRSAWRESSERTAVTCCRHLSISARSEATALIRDCSIASACPRRSLSMTRTSKASMRLACNSSTSRRGPSTCSTWTLAAGSTDMSPTRVGATEVGLGERCCKRGELRGRCPPLFAVFNSSSADLNSKRKSVRACSKPPPSCLASSGVCRVPSTGDPLHDDMPQLAPIQDGRPATPSCGQLADKFVVAMLLSFMRQNGGHPATVKQKLVLSPSQYLW